MSKLPDTLPVKPEGFTQALIIHMNFGRDGGAGKYQIKDPQGNDLPIVKQYDTRKGGVSGFFINGLDNHFKTWRELAEYWPEYIKSTNA